MRLFLIALIGVVAAIFTSPVPAEESIRVQWTPDNRGIRIIPGWTDKNSICALAHVKARADDAPAGEEGIVWASVEVLDADIDDPRLGKHPQGTWFISGNGETTEVAVRCTKLWRPKVVIEPGNTVQCDAGWENFSFATCPEGYVIVGGSCDFTCGVVDGPQFKHASSLLMQDQNAYRCGVISDDPGRTFTAHASCLKISPD
ncbi:MAG: hypothetical protein AAF439_10455 [Pseudomonadota bacterium]